MRDLISLREENERTSINGIIMPTLLDFDKKIALAIELWPQVNKDGGIDYLFGKGVGVELAIRGQVKGREKNPMSFPYRSHSDFEIYDCDGDDYNEMPEAHDFYAVFGGQELYPKTSTKGLTDIEPGLMDSTYEVVSYNGHDYLVPELELLFLDKYLKMESTPRQEGCDALLLMKQYHLNIDKINLYYEKYFKKPKMDFYYRTHNKETLYERQVRSVSQYFAMFEDELSNVDLNGFELMFNKAIDGFRKYPETGAYGGFVKFYPKPVKLCKKADGSYDFTDECKAKMKELIAEDEINFISELDSIQNDINDLYYSIYGKGGRKQY